MSVAADPTPALPQDPGPARGGIAFHDLHPSPADLRAEVLAGLSRPQRALPPKFFYDQRGSRLFDAITALPEYYLTRAEIGILRDHGAEMAERIGPGRTLIELGSGSSLKIRILLEALGPALYIPIDISRQHLLASAHALAECFPTLAILALCADYSAPFDLPTNAADPGQRAAFFPGSSIGNFEPDAAVALLARVAALLGPGGRLLIGADLIKDPAILHAAYNDAAGVTAAFNLNLLARIDRELDADFNLRGFAHRAFYNPLSEHGPHGAGDLGRIEMHLVSLADQRVRIGDRTFDFRQGETIHTESSYKYSLDGFRALAARAGFIPEQVWTDSQGLFSVHCLMVAGSTPDRRPVRD
jgi:dimethylhistidine N-methyltransferase